MDSLTFKPGRALFLSQSLNGRWAVVFEDEGPAGYCYACDRTLGEDEEGIIDAMLIYNGSSLEDREKERITSVQWSRDGLRAVLYLDGTAQAYLDFAQGQSCCRTDFPNFLDASDNNRWRRSSHIWDGSLIERFEAELYTN
ncbi:MAG: DUF2251 domain-containing protein [Acidobacteriaceae bacterium]|nr:DUF2251 domain-containing protein [Acidobacteriaceae bacterium]